MSPSLVLRGKVEGVFLMDSSTRDDGIRTMFPSMAQPSSLRSPRAASFFTITPVFMRTSMDAPWISSVSPLERSLNSTTA